MGKCYFPILLAVCSASASFAQEDLFDLNLEELVGTKVTIASRQSEISATAPSSVTVFTRDEIQAMGITHLESLMAYIPGFQAFRDVESGAQHSTHARGRRDVNSRGILFLINGVRINDALTGGASAFQRLLTVENIKQVEIIRGPGSALYGANAYMGAINLVTEKSTRQLKVAGGELSSTDATLNWHFDRGLWDFSLFARHFRDKGETYEDIYDQFGLQTSTQDPTKGQDLMLEGSRGAFNFAFRHGKRRIDDFYSFGLIGDGINRQKSEWNALQMSWQKQFRDWDFQWRGGYAITDWDPLALLAPKGVGPFIFEDFIGQPLVQHNAFSLNIDATRKLSEKHRLDFGVERQTNRLPTVIGIANYHLVTAEYYGEQTRQETYLSKTKQNNYGVYAQSTYDLNDRLTSTLGMRFDDYDQFGGTLSPRAALVYQTQDNGSVKLMYGEAFRAPTLGELYIFISPVDIGNPDLEPEKVKTLELAFIHMFSHFQVGATLFHNDLDGVILSMPSEAHGGRLLGENSGGPIMKGIELEANGSPAQGWHLRGNFTYIDGATRFTPEVFGGLIITKTSQNWTYNLNGTYHGAMVDFPEQDAYVLLNGKVEYGARKHLSLFLSGENLTDTNYSTPALAGLAPPPIVERQVPNRGRRLLAGISYRWD